MKGLAGVSGGTLLTQFMGMVGADEAGTFYTEQLLERGVEPLLLVGAQTCKLVGGIRQMFWGLFSTGAAFECCRNDASPASGGACRNLSFIAPRLSGECRVSPLHRTPRAHTCSIVRLTPLPRPPGERHWRPDSALRLPGHARRPADDAHVPRCGGGAYKLLAAAAGLERGARTSAL
jgi:hypothetical protein